VAPSELESTASLLVRVRGGDAAARDRLVERFLPALQRWARGRLPVRARGLFDTDDIVQITLLRALDRVQDFEPRHQGAFLAYLRQILLNQVRDQVRSAGRRPVEDSLPVAHPDPGASPLEEAIGAETLANYEAALAQLTPEQQEAVLLRIEFGMSYPVIAEALGSPSANAARMLVWRGLVRLAEVMDAR
jgi:RNA polymerase sigma-70 factor (ECF subfamily)